MMTAMVRLRSLKKPLLLLCAFCVILYISGALTHLYESDFSQDFHYPYDGDIEQFVEELRANVTPSVPFINSYKFKFSKKSDEKCKNVMFLRLVFIVKSAPDNWRRRMAIRSSWGFERRFSDVEIRTVFLVGERNDTNLQLSLMEENEKYQDLVQANFTDNYFNNTLKTMMGFTWAIEFCPNSKFYMFVDDDYYVSTKNILRFIRNPTEYPSYLQPAHANPRQILQFDFDLSDSVRLYTGYVFRSSPLRHRTSKWYISLEEYPYDMWPPYVTAGAYILSREALLDMYYASFYTKHFRFDDIYVGLLSYKCKIDPYHSEHFYFTKLGYNPVGYKYVVASHGYEDPNELLRVWTEQKEKGNA